MEETIKGKEVIAYKGMKYDMTCRDFKYEVGKTYKTDKAELYECGFHACLNPINVLEYYPQNKGSRYFKVKLSGEITECNGFDTNVAATEITILEEITFDEIIKTTEWWKSENVIDLLYFSDGLARVERGDTLYNFIDKQGKILLNEWFEWVDDFFEGFARVQRGDKLYNLIDTNGKLLTDEWFKWVGDFHEGFARVKRTNDEWNFIDTKGNILLDEWYKWVDDFHEGFAKVQRKDDKWNFIDRQGKLLSDEWFIDVYYLDYGLGIVQKANGEWCNIDKTGILIKMQ